MAFRRIGIAVLALLAAGALMLAGMSQRGADSKLEGIVLDRATDEPLQNVQIVLNDGTGATTDAHGRFLFQSLRSGTWQLQDVILNGYAGARVDGLGPVSKSINISVPLPAENENLIIRMVRAGVITGRLVQSDGTPLVNANVSASKAGYNDNGAPISIGDMESKSGTTDDRGEFRLFGLQPGGYYLGVYVGDPRTPEGQVYENGFVDGTSLTLDIGKASSVRVNGGVETKIGNVAVGLRKIASPMTALPDIPVRLQLSSQGGNLPRRASVAVRLANEIRPKTYTISENAIELPAMRQGPGGEILVEVTQPDGQRLYGGWQGAVDGKPVEIELKRAPRIRGRILLQGAGGSIQPLQGVQVSARSWEVPTTNLNATTDSDGRFMFETPPFRNYKLRLSGLSPNTFLVSQTVDGRDIFDSGITVSGDITIDMMTSEAGGTIEGTVEDARGRAIFDAEVAIVPDWPRRSDAPLYRVVETDQMGRFAISQIAPGDYHVFAWPYLNGAAYRNAEFMANYETLGASVRIEPNGKTKTTLTLLDDPARP